MCACFRKTQGRTCIYSPLPPPPLETRWFLWCQLSLCLCLKWPERSGPSPLRGAGVDAPSSVARYVRPWPWLSLSEPHGLWPAQPHTVCQPHGTFHHLPVPPFQRGPLDVAGFASATICPYPPSSFLSLDPRTLHIPSCLFSLTLYEGLDAGRLMHPFVYSPVQLPHLSCCLSLKSRCSGSCAALLLFGLMPFTSFTAPESLFVQVNGSWLSEQATAISV